LDWLSPIRDFAGFVFPLLEHVPVLRAILGFILVLFIPGFAWTLVFFRQIRVLERVVLSFALSMAIVTLSALFVNKLIGARINGFNSVLIIIVVTILPVAIYYLNRLIKGKRTNDA